MRPIGSCLDSVLDSFGMRRFLSLTLCVAVKWLGAHKYHVKRVMAGTYMTSLNMPGFSLTLLLLPSSSPGRSSEPYTSTQILELLDAPASAPGWAWTSGAEPGKVGAKAQECQVERGKEMDLARESNFIPPCPMQMM